MQGTCFFVAALKQKFDWERFWTKYGLQVVIFALFLIIRDNLKLVTLHIFSFTLSKKELMRQF